MVVNAKTGLYAILGDPISQAMSPVIMNRAFVRAGLDNVFLALKCGRDDVDLVLPALRKIDLKGYVFTMPIKELAAEYLDELRDEALITGAVNCVENRQGTLIGHNTDSLGSWTAILEKVEDPQAIKHMFVLGMGGFSKAAVCQAALQGVREFTVCNRAEETEVWASFRAFLERLAEQAPDLSVRLLPWRPEGWAEALSSADVIVNATPNGLGGAGDLHEILPYDAVKPGALFFDALYSPLPTAFLAEAERRGHNIVDGLDLLAHQGILSFRIWTGTEVAPLQMKRDALEFLAARQSG